MDIEKLLNLAKETLATTRLDEIKSINIEVEEDVNGTGIVSFILDYSESEILVETASFAIASELSTILRSQEINKRDQIMFK